MSYIRNFENSNLLRRRAHHLIPGGSHTYAKGDDQFPVLSPGFITKGLGCHVWDVDGNAYIEYGMGNRSVGLGHAYPSVLDAVHKTLEQGSNFTRPAAIEVSCATKFLDMVRTAEMVKFCKDGSHATTAAMRLARAVTGRDLIARCSDHPFFATDDWFIGTTEMNAGIPKAVRDLTLGFRYNDLESVHMLFARHPGRIAALIVEPARGDEPAGDYLRALKALCHDNGALFVLDEMITGFRWHNGGAQQLFDVVADLSCFGKALGNGFAISALAGKREFMELGGIEQTERPRVFLLSTTHGAETHAMAAAIATMKVYEQEPVIEHLHRQGTSLRTGLEQAAARHGIGEFFRVVGRASCLSYMTLDENGLPSQAFRSLLLQETIARGILAPSLVVSYTHENQDIERTIEAFDGAFAVYRRALDSGVAGQLVGRPSDVVFRKYNQPAVPLASLPHLVRAKTEVA
ncbi:glutamate-1-semialdehyde 2,1-aminomutase [Rhizobium sp. Root482]|uniref:glutamate-1-semialdehyde 2,1-aminomutase n=1 Tax=Rhizobium sp. Root482 TaxID=1736543 RepID=UPI0009E8CC61|nr:glutamate-1-semialdehyde 2,1-aminomutase [Rhizobium sp. Root482]